MKVKSSPHLLFFLRIWVGLIFAFAGYSKLMEPVENFRGMLAEYGVIPYALLPVIAASVPWLEFIFGIFMILGFAVPFTSLGLAFFCLCFLVVIGSSDVLLNSASSQCGCFGINGPVHLTVWQVFIMDFINLIIAGLIFLEKKTIWSLDSLLASSKDHDPSKA
jgi:uncharacterized membrane protein YphA (DoxX/SURF4 family)